MAVLAVVAVLTVGLGVGAAQLDFATGQDSYLDADTPTAVANHRYQELFGGEAMLVMFTMDEGSTVADLFTVANQERFDSRRGGHGRAGRSRLLHHHPHDLARVVEQPGDERGGDIGPRPGG